MAFSAYDAQGRLRKHPLQGTSLGVDPKRKTERKQFRELHTEAMGIGHLGREGMKERLKGRFRSFGQPQVQRLGALAEQRGGLEQQFQGFQNPEEEQRLVSEIERYSDLFDQVPTVGGEGAQYSFGWYARLPKDAKGEVQAHFDSLTKKQRTIQGIEQWDPEVFSASYFRDQGAKAETAHKEYLANVSTEVDRINQEFIPIQEETIEREQRLSDRIDLYNLFLGA